MAQNRVGCIFCGVALLILANIAAASEITFSDILEQSLSGSPALAKPAKASPSYYDASPAVELSTNAMRGCRVFGCIDGCDPDGGYHQSDHDCADSKQHYNNYNSDDTQWSLSQVFNKVAGCEWSYEMFKEYAGDVGDYYPIESPDGVYMQLGTVTGRCSFNGKADECHGPACNGMTFTMQGGMYVTVAYSHKPSNTLNTAGDPICSSIDFLTDPLQFRKALENKASARLPESCYPSLPSRNATGEADARKAGTAFELLWALQQCGIWNSRVFEQAYTSFIGPIGPAPQVAAASAPAPPREASAKIQYDSRDSYEHNESVYGGLALLFAGQTSISMLKGGDLKVEETGRIEYAPFFWELAPVESVQYNYPFVTGGNMKLWFRDEEHEEHHSRRRQ